MPSEYISSLCYVFLIGCPWQRAITVNLFARHVPALYGHPAQPAVFGADWTDVLQWDGGAVMNMFLASLSVTDVPRDQGRSLFYGAMFIVLVWILARTQSLTQLCMLISI
jgi:hypothetical protein